MRRKALLFLITMLILVLVAGTLGVFAAGQEVVFIPPKNIKARASSTGQMSTDPHNVVSREANARWASSMTAGDEQWLEIEYPFELELTEIDIHWYGNNNRAKNVQLSISKDGEDWVAVTDAKIEVAETSDLVDCITFPKQTGRFVRFDLSDPVGFVFSIRSVEIPGIEYNDPFIVHAGLGSGDGEAYLDSEGERLRLDVMIPIYTETFTYKFSKNYEYLAVEAMVNYRDFIEQVIGHNVQHTYHLVLSDEMLKRTDITEMEPNEFWLSSGNVWNNLKKFNVNPAEYDLVWSMWAWANRLDASQKYGGAAHVGPEGVPFMSYSVSSLGKNGANLLVLHSHEAQHTYEALFYNTGSQVAQGPPVTGIGHADFQGYYLEYALEKEPGLFEPWKSAEEAAKHAEGGPLPYPGKAFQLTVDAWNQRQATRENYLAISKRYGELVGPRGDLVIEPVFSSITVIALEDSREVFVPVRVRDRGLFVECEVTAKIGDQVIALEEDRYGRPEDIRLPRQERWRIGHEGHSYYGSWVLIDKEDTSMEITVDGDGFYEVFDIPIKYIVIQDSEIDIQVGQESYFPKEETNIVISDGLTKFGEGSSIIYEIPMDLFEKDYVEINFNLTGNGCIEIRAVMPDAFGSSIWVGEVKETGTIPVPKSVIKLFGNDPTIFIELRMPTFRASKFKDNPWFDLEEFTITGRTFY